jgi:amino acid transporter
VIGTEQGPPEHPGAPGRHRGALERHNGGLKRDSVGLLGTMGIAVGPQAPTGGINLLPAIMAGIVGASAALSFLLGLVAMLFVAYAFVIFSRRIASAGQLYSYTSVAAGSAYGVVTGFVWMVAFVAVAGWLCVQDGDYLVALFKPAGVVLPWLVMSLVMWAVMVIVTFRSIHLSAITVIVVEALGIGIMFIVAAVVIAKGGFAGHSLSLRPFTTTGHSFSVVMSGVVFAFTSFSGFEAAGALGEEARRPKWAIPVAIFSALVVSGLVYVFMTWVETVSFGSVKVFASQTTPLVTVADRYVGSGMGTVMNVAALISGFGAQLACLAGATRVLYALGRDGLGGRPRDMLTRTSGKFGTPLLPFAITSVLAAVSFLAFSGAGPLGSITDVSSYAADVEIIVYLLVVVAALIFCLRWERKPVHFVVLGIGIVVMGYVVKDTVYPIPAYPLNWAMYAALSTFGLGIALVVVFPRLRERFGAARQIDRDRMLDSAETAPAGVTGGGGS